MKKWRRIFLGLGSNLGDRKANCMKALSMLDAIEEIRIKDVSGWYETAPLGFQSEHMFLNGVAEGETRLDAKALIARCLATEDALGRNRREQGMDRPIDIDLLYMEGTITGYDDKTEHDITVPHPRIMERYFVLAPWSELAPDLYIPPFDMTVHEMLNRLETG
jgi:2-amino-4-hydroxy-6-hydroxymethyldihydropteridine diphosphokinase